LAVVRANQQRHTSSSSSSSSGSSSSSSSKTRSDYLPGAYNFAPASSLDDIVYGCEMPGFTNDFTVSVARHHEVMLTPAVVDPWAAFMQGQGISTVIVLHGQKEMFDRSLLDVYSAQGFTAHHLPMPARAPGNFKKITDVMEQAEQTGTKVVVHCTNGCHRVGTVLTAWIKHRHGLLADEAAGLMAGAAKAHAVRREPPSSDVLHRYMDGAM
jgi:hypothetical protein